MHYFETLHVWNMLFKAWTMTSAYVNKTNPYNTFLLKRQKPKQNCLGKSVKKKTVPHLRTLLYFENGIRLYLKHIILFGQYVLV